MSQNYIQVIYVEHPQHSEGRLPGKVGDACKLTLQTA